MLKIYFSCFTHVVYFTITSTMLSLVIIASYFNVSINVSHPCIKLRLNMKLWIIKIDHSVPSAYQLSYFYYEDGLDMLLQMIVAFQLLK